MAMACVCVGQFLNSGFWILDSEFWILDSGYWILDFWERFLTVAVAVAGEYGVPWLWLSKSSAYCGFRHIETRV